MTSNDHHRARSLRSMALMATIVIACAVLSACGHDANHGDCVGRVRFDGVLYEPQYDVNVAPLALARRLGTADLVDCGSVAAAPTVDSVAPRTIRGVRSSVAVVVPSGKWRGLYVAESIDRSAWPGALKRALLRSGG